MRRILFLDVDGVLNNLASAKAHCQIFRMNRECVGRLRAVVEDLGIVMVLSSTWRFAFGEGCAVAADAMGVCGWPNPPFIGHTPFPRFGDVISGVKRRGRECEQWIEENGEADDVYVAVDDDNDFAGFRGTLVLTDFEPGLTNEKADEVRAAFRGSR